MINGAIKRKYLSTSDVKNTMHCPLAITNQYIQFFNVTLRSIFIKNLHTTGRNLYNSFIILTNHECVNKSK